MEEVVVVGDSREGLRVSGLRKRVADFRLEADLEVRARERVAILGPSGVGKTTLLRLLLGLESPDQGSIRMGEQEWTSVPTHLRGIGYLSQQAELFESMSVIENAAFGLRVRGVGKAERRAQARAWLERVGLAARSEDSVVSLSGGEKQRLGLARAWVWNPRLILLDEPFSALDRELRRGLRAQLVTLHAEWPVPLVFVTHDEEDAGTLATRRMELRDLGGGVRRL